jgi:hypothetical protein
MRRTTVIAVTGVIALGATALALLLLGPTATGSPPGGNLAQMSNKGQPIEPGNGQRQELQNVGAIAVSRMATRAGRFFYRLVQPDGTVCYAIDTTGGDHLGNTSCPASGTTFPTSSDPVLDLSIFESTSHIPGDFHIVSAQGFAADGVASVALLNSDGRLVSRKRTAGNVYALDVPSGRAATSVVAYDARGSEVYRVP